MSNDRLPDVLALSLKDALAIVNSSPPLSPDSVKTSPLEAISSTLALRDTLALLLNLFTLIAPSPSSSAPHHTSRIPRRSRAPLAKELAALVSGSKEGTAAHEMALVAMGLYARLTGEAQAEDWVRVRLVGEERDRKLGAAGRALLGASAGESEEGDDDEEEAAVSEEQEEETDLAILIKQLNTLSIFLLSYQSLLASLPSSQKTSSSSPDFLSQTLHLRSILDSSVLSSSSPSSSVSDSDEEPSALLDETAKERFVDELYAVGRWAVGARGSRDAGDDSGFEDGL